MLKSPQGQSGVFKIKGEISSPASHREVPISMRNLRGTSTQRGVSEEATYRMRGPARVLVADNDPNTGRLLISFGKKEGYTVVTVEDGREAYRVLKSDGDFSAVVLDVTMPHLEGVEIVRYMKTEKRLMRIPVVVLAGAQGLKLITECFAAGAMAFLPKPFTAEQLRRTLRMAISSRLESFPARVLVT
jgi:CheY-like chemotaxis protein